MTSNLVVYASLEAQTEEIDDGWRAVQNSLGLFAYGKTADEASQRLIVAVNLLFDTLLQRGGKEAVTSRLERAGIDFTVAEKSDAVRHTLPLTLRRAKTLSNE